MAAKTRRYGLRQRPGKPFPFLRLPAELRNTIYKMAVVSEDPIEITTPQPAIAVVCRQLRNESLTLFYKENAFRDSQWRQQAGCLHDETNRKVHRDLGQSNLVSWLNRVGEGNRRHLKTVRLHACHPWCSLERPNVTMRMFIVHQVGPDDLRVFYKSRVRSLTDTFCASPSTFTSLFDVINILEPHSCDTCSEYGYWAREIAAIKEAVALLKWTMNHPVDLIESDLDLDEPSAE